MINYEVGGKLKLNKDYSHPFICKDVEYLITDVFDEYIYVQPEDKHKTSIPKNYVINDFTYTPPEKICKVCNGNGWIRNYDPTQETIDKFRRGEQFFSKYCPECTKPKQEEKPTYTPTNYTPPDTLGDFDKAVGKQEGIPQPKFKVGDKVRILSDAWCEPYLIDKKITMIERYGVKSAIGMIGTIDSISNGLDCASVKGFSEECFPKYQGYDAYNFLFDQLEKLIPITTEIFFNLKAGDKLICIENLGTEYIKGGEYRVLVGKPTALVIEIDIKNGKWFKPWDSRPIIEHFMLVEPKEDPNVLISKEQRLKAGMEIFQEDAGNPRVFNDMLDAIRCSVNHFKAKPNDIEFTPIEALKEITINITKEQAKEMGLCKEKPKKTKEQIRDIVIEELKAKGGVFNGFYYVLKDKLVIDFSKDKMLLGYASIELFHGGWAYQIPYNEHKSINKFLAKVDELLKPKYATCKVIGSLSEFLARETAAKVQKTLNELNPHWSKDDKPKFTKGQKIRCVNSEVIQYVPHIKPDNIYTFNEYDTNNIGGNAVSIEEVPKYIFNISFFEIVEYVDFSKALEWLKEGYTVARLGWDAFLSVKFQLNNPIVVWYCNGKLKDNFSSEDVMANDWYWVKKPEGK